MAGVGCASLSSWQKTALRDVVQTGAWILPDQRPLPVDLLAFLDAGPAPVYVGFGSMPMQRESGLPLDRHIDRAAIWPCRFALI